VIGKHGVLHAEITRRFGTIATQLFDLGGAAGDRGSTQVFGRLDAVCGVTLSSFLLIYSETATVMRYTFTKNRTSACLNLSPHWPKVHRWKPDSDTFTSPVARESRYFWITGEPSTATCACNTVRDRVHGVRRTGHSTAKNTSRCHVIVKSNHHATNKSTCRTPHIQCACLRDQAELGHALADLAGHDALQHLRLLLVVYGLLPVSVNGSYS
jgi:hypothetical protein